MELPLVHVFIEDTRWLDDVQIIGSWACLAWPLISQDPLAAVARRWPQRILPPIALLHVWLILFEVLTSNKWLAMAADCFDFLASASRSW